MKHHSRIFALILCMTILLTGISFASVASAEDENTSTEIKTGTLLTFGQYPQRRITDDATLAVLNSKLLNWNSFNYHVDGELENNMEYADLADVFESGDRYRAVRFSDYRADSQSDNGYEPGIVYWFEYEPLVWRVLDADAGLIMTEYLVDSQPFGNIDSNWENSFIRSWLNTDFYSTAFVSESEYIKNTLLTTDNIQTKDKIFLLSPDELKNDAYGFNESSQPNSTRTAFGTDYAKCQGLKVYNMYGGTSRWRTRSSFLDDDVSVSYDISVSEDGRISNTITPSIKNPSYGIRPAMIIDLTSALDSVDKCKWCGKVHSDIFGKIVGFFHSILYFFSHLFGRM